VERAVLAERIPRAPVSLVSREWRRVDPTVILPVFAITALGLLMVFSATRGPRDAVASTSFLQRQGAFAVLGVAVMFAATLVDYRRLREILPVVYGVTVLVLLAVLAGGRTVNGAKAWFSFGPIALQPSEFGKVVLIVVVSYWFGMDEGRVDLRRLTVGLGIVAVPVALILMQPDLGTVLVYGVIAAAIVVVAGARMRHLALLALVAGLAVGGAFNLQLVKQYQLDRLTVFIDDGTPSSGSTARQAAYWNLDQAKIAIGNGGITGQGLFNGTQNRGHLVPEQQTDFIFTVVGEELGFVGGAGLIAGYAFLAWRIWRVACRAPDMTGTLICVGVMAMIMFQVFESIGMTMGIMPITGIPLPFFSYGGSSILTSFFAMGLVLNVNRRSSLAR
jgi:rod shape determining protein RodA